MLNGQPVERLIFEWPEQYQLWGLFLHMKEWASPPCLKTKTKAYHFCNISFLEIIFGSQGGVCYKNPSATVLVS
jgi:hypothetical protein